MLHSDKSKKVCKQIIFSFLKKCLREPDEMASLAGFGPRAVVWRPCGRVVVLSLSNPVDPYFLA